MNESKIDTIIVIYNKTLHDSSACLRIKKYSDVIIVDNSTEENCNQLFCLNHGLTYISMGGNKGLSKAYNTAINQIKDTDAIVILDDDTEVPDEYYVKLSQALVEFQEVDIFAPIIRGQDGIVYSPNNYKFLKNELVKDPKTEVRQDRFNAISSCMAIRNRVFDDYRYNEKLFVDEIDHCFCRDQRGVGRKFGIIDIEIQQNFHQRSEGITAVLGWERLKIRINDIYRHARLIGSKRYIILAFIKCCGLGVQIGRKSKSIGVIIKAGFLSLSLLFHAS